MVTDTLPGFSAPPQNTAQSDREAAGADFEAWWVSYPRKRQRMDALRAYVKARRMFTAEQLEAARDGLIAEGRRCDSLGCGKRDHPQCFTPYPASFLNHDVEDYLPTDAPTPAPENVRVRDGRTERWYPASGWVREYVAGDG